MLRSIKASPAAWPTRPPPKISTGAWYFLSLPNFLSYSLSWSADPANRRTVVGLMRVWTVGMMNRPRSHTPTTLIPIVLRSLLCRRVWPTRDVLMAGASAIRSDSIFPITFALVVVPRTLRASDWPSFIPCLTFLGWLFSSRLLDCSPACFWNFFRTINRFLRFTLIKLPPKFRMRQPMLWVKRLAICYRNASFIFCDC